MRTEWPNEMPAHPPAANEGPPREVQEERATPPPVASSFTATRLVLAAAVVAVGVLLIGLTLDSLVPSSTGASDAEVSTEVAGAIETAPAPEVSIDDALSIERGEVLVPAAVEHLTVVQVFVSTCEERRTGSGVVVSDDLLLTAAHVVGDAGLVRVDHRGVTVTGEVLGVAGDGRDLALVRLDAPMAAPLAVAPRPAVDEPITLVGHPDGGPRTVLVGDAADVAPIVRDLAGGGDILGVDVAISAGISGGAAVDAAGDLVGIVVAKEEATDTALVLVLADLVSLSSMALAPGECDGSA
ncbi:MAG: serine protease [Actinomycetota bacterium]